MQSYPSIVPLPRNIDPLAFASVASNQTHTVNYAFCLSGVETRSEIWLVIYFTNEYLFVSY